MKKQILCVAIVIQAVFSISAQTNDKAVEKIRTYYTGVAEKAQLCENDDDGGEYGELFMNELVVNKRNHQWRAVGRHVLTYKFFYKVKDGDTEEHMYPDQLVLVQTEQKVSNRVYTEEYLYSDLGLLLYYFQEAENDDQSPTERRVYFSGIRPIRITEDGKIRDKLSSKDLATVREIRSQSSKIVEIFNRSIKL